MEITREKLVALWHIFERLVNERSAVKFHYGMLKNKRLIEPEVKSLQEASEPGDKMKTFDEARIKLCKAMCAKDETDNPVLINTPGGQQFKIDEEKQEEFDKILEELKEEHKEALDEREQQEKDFQELLQGTVEVEFYKIKMTDIPEKLDMFGREVELLYDIIDAN